MDYYGPVRITDMELYADRPRQNVDKEHPARFLTDTHEDYNQTWWQSVTMQEDVHTYKVNLTVNLGETQLCMFSSASVKETVNCMKHNPS